MSSSPPSRLLKSYVLLLSLSSMSFSLHPVLHMRTKLKERTDFQLAISYQPSSRNEDVLSCNVEAMIASAPALVSVTTIAAHSLLCAIAAFSYLSLASARCGTSHSLQTPVALPVRSWAASLCPDLPHSLLLSLILSCSLLFSLILSYSLLLSLTLSYSLLLSLTLSYSQFFVL